MWVRPLDSSAKHAYILRFLESDCVFLVVLQVGQIVVKVVSCEVGTDMVKVYGTDMEVKECVVADRTGKIKLNLWEGMIGQVVEGCSYRLTNLTVRNEGVVCVTTTRSTTINMTGDVAVPQEILKQVLEEPQEQCFTVEGKIIGVELQDRRQCPLCNKKQDFFKHKERLYRCEGCRMLQKVDNYLSSLSGLVVIEENHTRSKLTITTSVLRQYLIANNLQRLLGDKDQVEEHFCDGGEFIATYTKNEVISCLQKAEDGGEVGDDILLEVSIASEPQPSTSSNA